MAVDDLLWDISSHREGSYALEKPQLPDEPCELAYFVHGLKLTQIVSFILRSVVSVFRLLSRKLFLTPAVQYSISSFKLANNPTIIEETESALQEWYANIPNHRKRRAFL